MPDPALFDTAIDNRSLFSDHYLEERLPERAAWREDVSAAFEAAKARYRQERAGLQAANEAQTEEDFIKPLLDLMGWHYDVQVEARKQGKRNVPDYALFTNEAALHEAKPLRKTHPGAYFARTAAMADAKYWGRPLDSAGGDAARETLTNANPSFQIVNYMTAAHVDWGLLTNGARWRLYYAGARSRIDTYYEANLDHILREGSEDDFRRFFLFFRAAAFRPDPVSNRTFLESVYDGSVQYGKALEGRLKDLVFEDIFLHLARGFLEQMDESAPAQAELDAVYHGTLRLLYRLLFLLHAEARALLPVDERQGYYHYSLARIKEDVAEAVRKGRTLSGVSTDTWSDLESLFRIIDRGEAGLNVPRYNGGLFDAENPRNAFLNEHAVADAHLVPAIDKLARDADGYFVDYKALDVEQLGSIYEGLLEFRLRMKACPGPRSGGGTLVLENDKGERKATGSYYTPHYIVEYIVENTLGPVLEEREQQFRRLMDEQIVPKYEKLARLDPGGPSAEGLRAQLKPLEREAAEALLGLKVCDPAMGSGHFLVYATDYLTERFITVLNDYPDNPVLRRLAKIRGRITRELGAQGLSVDEERLKDTSLLKRLVMKRCIYGVDLNPMAVELARLSLWLDSFTVGAPLSFLNHHLKTGNSLIGEEVRQVEGQLKTDLFGSAFAGMLQATELMQAVAFSTDATFEEVAESARHYADYEAGIAPYKRMLDLWTSRHFEHPEGAALLRDYGGQVRDALRGNDTLDEKQQATLEEAEALAREKQFFHWELAFPEVFFDLHRANWKTNPGFDAVIGNPPYVRGRVLPTNDKKFYASKFSSAYKSYDLYVLFVELGIKLLRLNGFWSMIVPRSLLTESYGKEVRKLVLTETEICSISDYLGVKVFSEASVINCIPTLKSISDTKLRNQISVYRVVDDTHFKIDQSIFHGTPQNTFRLELTPEIQEVLEKVKAQSFGLYELCYVSYSIAAHSEVEEKGKAAYLFSSQKSDKCKPFIEGKEIDRYAIRWAGRYLEYDPKVLRRPSLPDLFENPKIAIVGISGLSGIAAALDEKAYYVGYPAICLTLKHYLDDVKRPDVQFETREILTSRQFDLGFLLAVINSQLIKFYFDKMIFSTSQTIYSDDIRNLPIREIAFTTPEDAREDAVREAVAAYEEAVAQQELLPWTGEVPQSGGGVDAGDAKPGSTTPESPPIQEGSFQTALDLVNQHLTADPERADVVHDLLAHLAREMTRLHRARRRLDAALDPFKFLDRGAAFAPFPEVFGEAIKYGARLSDGIDLSAVHHDLDGLRLTPEPAPAKAGGQQWQLDVQLKMRDPESGWQDWQKDGHQIERRWTPAYRFDLSEERARYYQHAFEALDRFAHAASFPGGYTRTTEKKLRAAQVPAFDPAADLTPLVELSQEHAAVEAKITRTDALIDRIVYRLYGLTDEEIAVVEGRD